jgi:hypothetical protein
MSGMSWQKFFIRPARNENLEMRGHKGTLFCSREILCDIRVSTDVYGSSPVRKQHAEKEIGTRKRNNGPLKWTLI